MIKSIFRFLSREVFPRWREIVVTSDFVMTCLFVCALRWARLKGLGSPTEASDVIDAVLNYGSIAFGFAVSGLTMALAISDSSFIRKLVTTTRGGTDRDTYSDLLFVYSWTAMVHVFLIALCLVGKFVYAKDAVFFGPDLSRWVAGYSMLVSGVCAYALMHFGLMVLNLTSFGRTFVAEQKKAIAKDKLELEEARQKGLSTQALPTLPSEVLEAISTRSAQAPKKSPPRKSKVEALTARKASESDANDSSLE